MDEILELRHYIESAQYDEALLLIGEMEEMAKEDKINKVYSFCVILLLHCIKQDAEQHTTRSWDVSVQNALRSIARTNKRRNAGGFYIKETEWADELADAFDEALSFAALEAFGGVFSSEELLKRFDRENVLERAQILIAQEQERYATRKSSRNEDGQH
jgi:hypothetical protein